MRNIIRHLSLLTFLTFAVCTAIATVPSVAFADVPNVVLESAKGNVVVVELTSGAEVPGTLQAFDATSVVVARSDGRLVTVARIEIGAIRLAGSRPQSDGSTGGTMGTGGSNPTLEQEISAARDAYSELRPGKERSRYLDDLTRSLSTGTYAGEEDKALRVQKALKQASNDYRLSRRFKAGGNTLFGILIPVAGGFTAGAIGMTINCGVGAGVTSSCFAPSLGVVAASAWAGAFAGGIPLLVASKTLRKRSRRTLEDFDFPAIATTPHVFPLFVLAPTHDGERYGATATFHVSLTL